jgi:lipoprotein-releasing system permease protein
MIVVNSVMAGFSTEMRERIHGILADIVLEANSLDGAPDPEWQMRRIREAAGEYIAAMTPTVEVYGMLSFRYGTQYITKPVTLIGIDPESKSRVGTLADHLESYKAEKDASGAIVGPALRPADQPPDWDLLPPHQEYRNYRTRQPQLDLTDEDDEPVVAADDSPETNLERAIDEERQPRRLTQEELSRPLPARVYIGYQLVSFQTIDPETGKVRIHPMIGPGDDVAISTVTAARPPKEAHFNATVVDIFKSGMSEYDSSLVFCNLDEFQQVRGMIAPDGTRAVTSIQIRLKNYADADKVVERLRSAFEPDRFRVSTWEQKQGPLLAAVEVESAILNVLLFLIIAVAGFGILAIFFMIVVEKTRDIGILKSLGASSQGVLSIFLSYGLSLGIVGSGVGVAVGLLFVRYINEIEGGLTWLTGRKVFDQTIYYFPSIPTRVSPLTVLWVAVGAIGIAVLASILPARRAASLNPVRALRNE